MNNEIKKLLTIAVMGGLIFANGCASTLVYRHSADEIRQERIARGEQVTEPTFFQTLANKPVLQTGALIVDVIAAAAAYNEYAKSDIVPKTQANDNTSGESTTIVQGDGNTVSITRPIVVVPPVAPAPAVP